MVAASVPPAPVKPTSKVVPTLLTWNGGYVDTAGFLALNGLFTAHVTGNFVTTGATLVQGTQGAALKLLALPVFCVFVVLCNLFARWRRARSQSVLPALLCFHTVLLLLGCLACIILLSAAQGSNWQAMLCGLTLVAAMGAQNGINRAAIPSSPPSTLMTGTTTQVMMDLSDGLFQRCSDPALRARLKVMVPQIIIFALGCGAAALIYAVLGAWSFFLPPLIAIAATLYAARHA